MNPAAAALVVLALLAVFAARLGPLSVLLGVALAGIAQGLAGLI